MVCIIAKDKKKSKYQNSTLNTKNSKLIIPPKGQSLIIFDFCSVFLLFNL